MKLVVTADVHGSYSTWLTIKSMLKPEDALAVAGDLFGTCYPRLRDNDYQPERILQEISEFNNPLYFVYGNCDSKLFSPGYKDNLIFDFMKFRVFLHHGDKYFSQIPPEILSEDVNLVIQGHTHVFSIEKKVYTRNQDSHHELIFLNPGSLAAPRTSFYTYAVVDSNGIKIIDIKTATCLKSVSTI
ncbi:MAG: YfcE family phosphodiesterase [Desulfamplus sp.]|nr:YfcE family phosphodiesterase [Desulfamplus sp.]